MLKWITIFKGYLCIGKRKENSLVKMGKLFFMGFIFLIFHHFIAPNLAGFSNTGPEARIKTVLGAIKWGILLELKASALV